MWSGKDPNNLCNVTLCILLGFPPGGGRGMDAATLNRVGARAVECRKFKQAVALLSNAVEAEPGLAWAWYNLGSAHVGLCGRSDEEGQLVTALRCYQQVGRSCGTVPTARRPLPFGCVYGAGCVCCCYGRWWGGGLPHHNRNPVVVPCLFEFQVGLLLTPLSCGLGLSGGCAGTQLPRGP